MEIGLFAGFQNWHENLTDEEMFVEELRLLERGEELGFDSLCIPEHHFDDYSMCPDNVAALCYLAARTKRVKLATGAVIVPWNDPLRVVEKLTMLDHMSGGRMVLGLGRGLARMEYEQFGIPMEEARERFDEAAPMIVRGLETGIVEGNGKFYKQPRATVRPKPTRPIRDRLFCVAISPESVDVAVQLGAAMTTFVQKDITLHAPEIERYRKLFQERYGRAAPPPILTDVVYCGDSMAEAEEIAERHIARYFLSVVKHYDFAGTHFRDIKGYQAYEESAAMIRAAGLELAARAYRDSQSWGTPEAILPKYARWKDVLGEFSLNVIFNVAGMPYDVAERSQRKFAAEVMPALRELVDGHRENAA